MDLFFGVAFSPTNAKGCQRSFPTETSDEQQVGSLLLKSEDLRGGRTERKYHYPPFRFEKTASLASVASQPTVRDQSISRRMWSRAVVEAADFGIGIKMKVAMATFSTVLVAMSQAYEGGKNISPELRTLFELHNSSNAMMFWKLILPSSMDWVLASLRLNIGCFRRVFMCGLLPKPTGK